LYYVKFYSPYEPVIIIVIIRYLVFLKDMCQTHINTIENRAKWAK